MDQPGEDVDADHNAFHDIERSAASIHRDTLRSGVQAVIDPLLWVLPEDADHRIDTGRNAQTKVDCQ